jgi:hypothetical protein
MLRTIRVFILGFVEFRSSFGMTYDDDRLTEAYDRGRDLAHRLTLRRFDV